MMKAYKEAVQEKYRFYSYGRCDVNHIFSIPIERLGFFFSIAHLKYNFEFLIVGCLTTLITFANQTTKKMIFENTREFAQSLDAKDELRNYREEFYFPKVNGKQVIYFIEIL